MVTQGPDAPGPARSHLRRAWLTDCPLEITEMILSQLSPLDLKKLRLVSKETQRFIDAIWKPLRECSTLYCVPMGPNDAMYAEAVLKRGLDPELLAGEIYLHKGIGGLSIQGYPFARIAVRCVKAMDIDDCNVQQLAKALAASTALHTLILDGVHDALQATLYALAAIPQLPPSLEIHFHCPLTRGANSEARFVELESETAEQIVALASLKSLVLVRSSSWDQFEHPLSRLSHLTRLEFHKSRLDEELPLIFELPELKALVIDECRQTKLPPIEKAHGLKKLAIRCKGASDAWEVHGDFRNLRELEDLEITNCRMAQLQISGPLRLKRLSFDSATTMSKLPFNLVYCSNLQSLHIGAAIRTLPEGVGNLQSLSQLGLRGLAVKKVPAGMSKLTSLTSLTMDQCRSLRTLPNEVGFLTNLRELVYNCGKAGLPPNFSRLVNLESCSLGGAAAREVSEVMYHWRKLRVLKLSHVRDKDAPAEKTKPGAPAIANIRAMPSVSSLTLTNVAHSIDDKKAKEIAELLNGATNLHSLTITNAKTTYEYLSLIAVSHLSTLTNLRELSLDFLTRGHTMDSAAHSGLFKSIASLTGLRVLDLSRNQMRHLPACVFALTNLEVLRANRNMIFSVPSDIYHLQRLRVLELASTHNVKLCVEVLMIPNLIRLNMQVDMGDSAYIINTLVGRGVFVECTVTAAVPSAD